MKVFGVPVLADIGFSVNHQTIDPPLTVSFTMAHAVELPGESNPLTPQNVLSALGMAASSTQQQVQTGTKQLQHWEKQEKYHSFLQVFETNTIPLPGLRNC